MAKKHGSTLRDLLKHSYITKWPIDMGLHCTTSSSYVLKSGHSEYESSFGPQLVLAFQWDTGK